MNIEEARQLKPGDKVLIEAKVTKDCSIGTHIDSSGNVLLTFPYHRESLNWLCDRVGYAHSLAIREKIVPPRRKFRKGDIVKLDGEDQLYTVRYDENGSRLEIETSKKNYKVVYRGAVSLLSLVCAAEDRADRKEEA